MSYLDATCIGNVHKSSLHVSTYVGQVALRVRLFYWVNMLRLLAPHMLYTYKHIWSGVNLLGILNYTFTSVLPTYSMIYFVCYRLFYVFVQRGGRSCGLGRRIFFICVYIGEVDANEIRPVINFLYKIGFIALLHHSDLMMGRAKI